MTLIKITQGDTRYLDKLVLLFSGSSSISLLQYNQLYLETLITDSQNTIHCLLNITEKEIWPIKKWKLLIKLLLSS